MGLGLCAALLAGAPMAQTDPTELDTALSGVLVDGGSAAPLLRCMALFRAIRLQPGDNMGIGADAARREADLAAVAVVIWQSETATGGTRRTPSTRSCRWLPRQRTCILRGSPATWMRQAACLTRDWKPT
jgi:hypothetical protein